MRKLLTVMMLAVGLWTFGATNRVSPGTPDFKFDTALGSRAALKKIFVLHCIHSAAPLTAEDMNVLIALQQRYAPNGLTVAAVSTENVKELQEFARDYPGLNFSLYSDAELKSPSTLYKTPLTPFRCMVFDGTGKVLWSGEVIDLPALLERLYNGRYSERDEMRISALENSLRAALRSGEPAMIGESAERILAIRPGQLSALRAKAFALESSGRTAELARFLTTWRKRYPKIEELYFMQLNLALRTPALSAEIAPLAEDYFRNFPDNVAGINGICWSLLTQAPFSAPALATALQAGARLEKLTVPPTLQARVGTTQALLAYRCGKLATAIRLQEKAAALAAGKSEKELLNNVLNYYRFAAQAAEAPQNEVKK